MRQALSERRQVENEVYFRQYNKQVQKGFDAINKTAEEQDDEPYRYDRKMPLLFYCECPDENCVMRVEVNLDEYNSIHEDNKAFVIVPGHEVKAIERVIEKRPKYWVVEKFLNPPKQANMLHPTNINNT